METADTHPASLEFAVSWSSQDDALVSLANKVPLSAGAANGDVYVSLNGGTKSILLPLPQKSTLYNVSIPIDLDHPDSPFVIDSASPNHIMMQNGTELNFLATVQCVGALGFYCHHDAGHGAVELLPVIKGNGVRNGGSVVLQYSSSNGMFAAVGIHSPAIVDANGQNFSVRVVDNPMHPLSKASEKISHDALLAYVTRAALRREEFVYAHLPGLTKTFVVHSGVSGEGYSTVAGLTNRPVGLSAHAIDSWLNTALLIELENDEEEVETFVNRNQETHQSGIHMDSDAHVAAQGLQRFVRGWYSYVADKAIVRTGTGLTTLNTEHWAPASKLNSLNDGDCDDGAMDTNRAMCTIGISPWGDSRWEGGIFHSIDPGYDPARHRVTTAIRSALVHHVAGLAVVGARGARGSAVSHESAADIAANEDVNGRAPRQGHAVTMVIPWVDVVNAVAKGASLLDASKKQASVDELYRQMRGKDAPPMLDPRKTQLNPFVIDSTVTSSTKLAVSGTPEEKADEAAQINAEQYQLRCARDKLGAVIADPTVELRLMKGYPHGFWGEFLEWNLWGVDTNTQFVFVADRMGHKRVSVPDRAKTARVAGASVLDISSGEFSLVRLVDADPKMEAGLKVLDQRAILRSPQQVQRSAMAVNSTLEEGHDTSMAILAQLNKKLVELSTTNHDLMEVAGVYRLEMNIPFRAILGNPSGVAGTAAAVLENSVGGQVDLYTIKDVLHGKNGEDVAVHAVITAAIDCRDVETS